MIAQFLWWYLAIQLTMMAALPLTLRLFSGLPDRGYAFAKSLGIFLVGLVLWLGTSYGLLRNETGGAWLSLLIVALLSLGVSRNWFQKRGVRDKSRPSAAVGDLNWRYLFFVELLFFVAFAAWAYVRLYDPAANHTEQPMDLMFMNGIWNSPTYPPQDPWLAGYAISYYYFGYWLLLTVARLAGQAPEIAFNVGQASWFGLLLVGAFGIGYNLVAYSRRAHPRAQKGGATGTALFAGLLSSIAVGVTGNLQVLFEFLYANGVNVSGLARWFDVHNFPENAAVTNNWYIGFDWWWWRSSRVLEDLDFGGNHIEVIDEFPMFSYILGDNHPHVLAMPFVLLVIALAMNLLFAAFALDGGVSGAKFVEKGTHNNLAGSLGRVLARLLSMMPGGFAGLLLVVAATGALFFLNTWDFPPYWLLVLLCGFAVLLRGRKSENVGVGNALLPTGLLGVLILVGMVILYFPYFLTAQSQAGGILPNFFYPTRLPQFLLMFGPFLLGTILLILLGWVRQRPARAKVSATLALTFGVPILWLVGTFALASRSEWGQQILNRLSLPPDVSSYGAMAISRWFSDGATFLLIGLLLALVAALIWQRFETIFASDAADVDAGLLMALMLAAIGLLLVFAPEFVYLRDNFGTRMNTIFKFYYQAWLLLGLSSAFAITVAWQMRKTVPARVRAASLAVAGFSLLFILSGLLFPFAAAYSKTGGFGSATPTFDATAYIRQGSPDEIAAIDWVRRNTPPNALIVEGKGASYRADYNRISTITGRPTLLGWDGHESQWRGQAYGEMAQGRPEVLDRLYRSGNAQEIEQILDEWEIDYLYVGPMERSDYQISAPEEERLRRIMDLVFESGSVRIYARRSS